MATIGDQQGHPERINRLLLILNLGTTLVFFLLGLFVPAGTLAWLRGWLF